MQPQRLDGGDLPNGGSYAMITYRDADGSAVAKNEAMSAEIVEYDRDDRPITMTFLTLGAQPNQTDAAGDAV